MSTNKGVVNQRAVYSKNAIKQLQKNKKPEYKKVFLSKRKMAQAHSCPRPWNLEIAKTK